ncbi:S-layer homology domain-containing protein [Paenibacillus sp. NPDC058071]|uniref:S-layer homology domain-containing protein n=1 Tax=Paenibacillus sp. NPDC058071 TaxID=3346326 RepID=UPI0036DC12F6
MKKSVLCLLIALLVIGSSLSYFQYAHAAESDFTFTVGSDGAAVTGYLGTDPNVVIPAALAGASVTSIERSAFDTYGTGRPKLTSVVIPDSVTNIKTYGFRYNSLSSIDLPDGLLTIGASAFENNPLTNVVFPDSVKVIGNYAFYMNQLTSITLSENLISILGGAFDTNDIARLVIPAGVTSIAASAFFDNNVTSLTVLGAATNIAANAFERNPSNLKVFGIANSPAAAFAASNSYSFVDGTALFEAFSTAKSLLASHMPGTGVGQVMPAAYNDLAAARDTAKLFIDGIGNATVVSDLTNAAIPLTAAIAAFQSQIIRAGNSAALGGALTEAKQALINHPAGTDMGQASEVDRSALQSAINAAQQIFDQAGNLRQDELDVAVANLETAMDTFDAAIIPAGSPLTLGNMLTNAQLAMTDHPQGVSVGQTSPPTRAALQAAINMALQIYQSASQYSQSQLDAAAGALSSAVQTFKAAVIGPGNPAALGAAIPVARQALTIHSEGTGVGQTSAVDRSALQSAIDEAQQIFDQAGLYSQSQLNDAVADLEAAMDKFEAAIIRAGDADELEKTLADAVQLLADHPEGTGVGQASAAARSDFQSAIDTAQAIAGDAKNQTQGQLNDAVADLETAMDTFEAAIIPAGDATDLVSLLAYATQLLADHPEGTGVGQASAAVRSNLQSAIDTAQAIAGVAQTQTQGQLDDAAADLETAKDTFEAAIIPAGDATDLVDLLAYATQLLADHSEGTGVGQASAAARSDLQSAIDTAQAIAGDAQNQTQGQLDDAAAHLETAKDTFEAAIIPAGDATDLVNLLADATQLLVVHPEGTGVGQASAAARSDLQSAIDTAQAIAGVAQTQTQGQLDDAVADLETATDIFEAAIIPAGDATELVNLLENATQLLADHPEGTGVGQASAAARSDLQSAIDTAQAIADDVLNQTQHQLDDAAANLETALETFDSAWVQLVLTVPFNNLYGKSDTLRFTVTYGYEVTVTGTPTVPLLIGEGAAAQTAYASYTGTRGSALTELTFEYEVPADLVDVDGIEVANALDLPNGASIVRSSGEAASLTYQAPDTSGIRIMAKPPVVTLTSAPNGSALIAISVMTSVNGVTAGNTLTKLRWLPGSLHAADFADGTEGTDILAASQFTVTANGDYTVYARDGAGNESVKGITVTGISKPSSSNSIDQPITSNSTVMINPDGGITVLVQTSDIKQVTRPDGTTIEQVILSEQAGNRVLELLKDAKKPLVTIEINDQEQVVQTRFPADWIVEMAEANPNAIIEAKLNGSSYRLRISALDLAGLAKRLNAELSDLSVSIIQEQAGEEIRQKIMRLGVSQGFTVFGGVIDYKVIAEANGQASEVRDFGATYMVRTIKLDGTTANRNLVAVQYDPATGTVVFVPARLETAPDGSTEAILSLPHNSLYTVIDVQARTFADLAGHWAKADVEHLASKLLVNGKTANHFAPDETISRAEFLALLVRGLGLSVKEKEGSTRFVDVPASAWYAPLVYAAVENGLVKGNGEDRFASNDPITREQMAVLIGNVLSFIGHETDNDKQVDGYLAAFTDRDSISSWAKSAVARAAEAGIMKGMVDGRFAPTENATRAQAAVMFNRLLQYLSMID